MDKLIEIAEKCGAVVMPKGTQVESVILKDAAVVLTPAELHATIEQVCAPLVDLLEFIEIKKGSYAPLATQQLEEFRVIMGDRK